MPLSYATNGEIRRDLYDAFVEARPPDPGYKPIFTPLPVESRAGAIKVLPLGSVGTPTSITRTAGSAYTDVSMVLQSVSYTCSDYGLSVSLDQAAEYPLSMEVGAARALRARLEAGLDDVAYSLLWGTGGAISTAYGNMTTLAVPWTDPSADPVADIVAAAEAIAVATGGYRPTLMVIGPDTLSALVSSPAVVGRYPAVDMRGEPQVAAGLAALLGLDQVVVARTRTSSGYRWADRATLAIAATPGSPASEPAACRMAVWSGDDAPDPETGWVVETIDDPVTRSRIVRARINAGLVVVSPRGLYGIANTV